MQLLEQTGNCSSDSVEEQRKILQSFLMRLEFGKSADADNCDVNRSDENAEEESDRMDPGARCAMKYAMPAGFFPRTMPYVRVVSRPLGIGYLEMLYLRYFLGEEKFNKLLIAHGLLGKGLQSTSPVEPSWTCPGPPACGNVEAKPCQTKAGENYAMMVGSRSPHHCFWGGSCADLVLGEWNDES